MLELAGRLSNPEFLPKGTAASRAGGAPSFLASEYPMTELLLSDVLALADFGCSLLRPSSKTATAQLPIPAFEPVEDRSEVTW